MNIRRLENSKKYGYLFYISYRGKKFASFDENKDKKTVKSEFKRIMEELGFSWAKGVQQAARTDAGVSSENNILYVSSNFNEDYNDLKEKFNVLAKGMKINKIEKTISNLVIPELIEERIYHYYYPKAKINKNQEDIEAVCKSLSGTKDVSEFTDEKGKLLKEKIRTVNINFDGEKLIFRGSSFMPKQVRIMSAFIFTGEKKIFPAKHLTLIQVSLKDELKELILEEVKDVEEENVSKIEKCDKFYIFYVKSILKGELIGKKGSNIKKLRKKYGEIIIKEV